MGTSSRTHVSVGTRRLLVGLFAAPVSWTLHLLASYAAISIGCATDWQRGTRIVVVALTLLFAAGALTSAWAILRDWPRPVHLLEWLAHTEQHEPGHAFLRGLGLLATVVFVLAILLGGFGSLMVPLCSSSHH